MSRRARLIEIEHPDFGAAAQLSSPPPPWRVSLPEYRARLDAVRAAMEREKLSHLVVYGDREHFANLAWLTGFDPRFEEALCLLHPHGKPKLVVGNECRGYAPAAPLVAAGDLEVVLCTDFSLPDQPRSAGGPFEGVQFGPWDRVGVVGWKSYPKPTQSDLPAYLLDELRERVDPDDVVNATHLFIGHDLGLRTVASEDEIAFFEYTNVLASEAMKRVLAAVRPGRMDHEILAEAAGYNGVPLGCHMTLKCGQNRVSLASARGERIEAGGRFSCGICYWGANVCRCGWVADDVPGYVEDFAGPYFTAMAAWLEALRVGATGGELHASIHDRLGDDFHVFLNAGHLIHLDEWVNAPVWQDSPVRLRSGMVIQADVIPSHPQYYSSRMEDGYLIADEGLQARLRQRFPALVARCEARRRFLNDVLGIVLCTEVLPLSNLCAQVAPYVVHPKRIFAL